MRKRHIVFLIALALVAGAFCLLIWMRQHLASRPVRLLPESDAVVYLNVQPIRLVANLGQQSSAVARDPDYAEFVAETGFDPERDLDEVAAAVHFDSVPAAQRAPGDDGNRFSQVLIGNFDSQKLSTYLKKLARSTERFDDHEIFEIAYEGRTIRVAILNVDTVAVTNVEDASVIRGIIERSHHTGLPQKGPMMVQQYWKEIPHGSLAWIIAKMPAPRADVRPVSALAQLGGGFTLLASVAPSVTSADVRATAIFPNEAAAKQVTDNLNTLLSLFRGVDDDQHAGGDPDVKALLSSIHLQQSGDRATLNLSLPYAFIRKAVAQAPQSAPEIKAPSDSAPPATPPKHTPKPASKTTK